MNLLHMYVYIAIVFLQGGGGTMLHLLLKVAAGAQMTTSSSVDVIGRDLKSFALPSREGKWRSLTLLLPIAFG